MCDPACELLGKKGRSGEAVWEGGSLSAGSLSPEQLYIPNKFVSTFQEVRTFSLSKCSMIVFSIMVYKLADHSVEFAYVILDLVDAIPV